MYNVIKEIVDSSELISRKAGNNVDADAEIVMFNRSKSILMLLIT